MVEGLAAVRGNRDLLLPLGLAAAQTVIRGALTVFTVVVAIDLLDAGEAGVSTLNGAVGVGAVVGSLVASMLVAPDGWPAGSGCASPGGGCRWRWSG